MKRTQNWLFLAAMMGCTPTGQTREAPSSPDTDVDTDEAAETGDTAPPSPCPTDMVAIEDWCIDTYEAPNIAGEYPLVMYTFHEAAQWCEARSKRLCFDDEWQLACGGSQQTSYPYGNTHQPGVCNDEEVWRIYDQSLLNAWPASVCDSNVMSVDDLFSAAAAINSGAAEHVEWLYQGERGGSNLDCGGEWGVFDLSGNVEEWTRRRDGGSGAEFLGNLKGRYWAEARTCQSNIYSHGNGFRFYEIGFRCCLDQ
ncbi:MAG: SUMF1/EgtB/PvdO family nonheme iron enzyme [Proteobacteria bacterium]|nr:SUMF1/EgtB/PvdO family nonheme iron enzyme [Pseudomonadota bacterium]